MTLNRIFLIRHATPDWERRDIPYHLPPGPPLTAQGLIEASALGEFLRHHNISHMFSSPLERCQHTTAISSSVTSASYQIDERITEWQPGEDEDAVISRIRGFLEEVCWQSAHLEDLHDCNQCALVSHGGPIAMFLLLLGLDPKVLSSQRIYDHGNPLPPGGVWLAERKGTKDPWRFELVFTPQLIKD